MGIEREFVFDRQTCLHKRKLKVDRSVYFLEPTRGPRNFFVVATSPSSSAASKRDQLLHTAWRLFYRDGYRAVGIDPLLAEAGVAKMTLYHHFASKEELIVAVLEARSSALLASVDESIAAAGRSPAKQLSAVFAGLKSWFSTDDFKGCAFIRALSEYPDPAHPIHQAAWEHKRGMNARLKAIAASAGVKDPAALADTLSLLIDGAIITAHATESAASAESARLAALSLLKLATP